MRFRKSEMKIENKFRKCEMKNLSKLDENGRLLNKIRVAVNYDMSENLSKGTIKYV